MRVSDVDLATGTLTVRERKRVKGTRSTRRAPITPALDDALRGWLAIHPGGMPLFCRVDNPRRMRPTPEGASAPLAVDEVHRHFRRTFAGSEWSVVRGLHVLRHSFASCMAAAGVDQRVIDAIMGHSSEAMRRRYRHLSPNVTAKAVNDVFG
jgi:integrase